MISKLAFQIRRRWHPLWRLRKSKAFRFFQKKLDPTVFRRIEGTNIPVAMKMIRDATLVVSGKSVETEILAAFDLLCEISKPSVFWDVGANIGYYAWASLQKKSVKQVLMFEPDPVNFRLLNATIHRNGLTQCQVKNVALSNQEGTAEFLIDEASGATGALSIASKDDNDYSLHHAYGMKNLVICQTMTVDGLIQRGNPPPDLMKIEVEGAENLVFEGARKCLAENEPCIIVETSNFGMVSQICQQGYQAFAIDDGNFVLLPGKMKSHFSRIEKQLVKLPS